MPPTNTPECVIKDTPEAAVGLEKCKWTINALINHHYKIVAASWQAKNNAARTLVMPVIKENTLTEGNNNHWNPGAARTGSTALTKPNKKNSIPGEYVWHWKMKRATDRTLVWWKSPFSRTVKIELIVNNIANVPEENNHSHEASARADGVDGVVMDLDVTDSFGDNTDRNGDALPEDNLTPRLYDAQDKRVTLTNKPCSTDNPLRFLSLNKIKKRVLSPSPVPYPAPIAGKQKLRPTTTVTMWMSLSSGAEIGGLNAFIYRVGGG